MIFTGYLLTKNDYKEADEIISVLSNSGKRITILAKGTRKLKSKNQHALNVLNLIEFNTLQKGDLHILKTAKIIKDNTDLLMNLSLSASYLFAAELISKADDLNSQKIYDMFNKIVNSRQAKYSEITKLLLIYSKEQGVLNELGNCAKCGTTDYLAYFSLRNGGMMCKKCSERKLKVDTLVNIYTFMRTNKFKTDFDNIQAVHLIKELTKDILEITGTGINSANFFLRQLPEVNI